MPEPGFFDETHWRFAIQFYQTDGVTPLDLTGKEQLRAVMYDKHGQQSFVWLAANNGPSQGTIIVTDIATGLIILDATLEQHELVEEGEPYTWTLYDIEDPADPYYIANGTAYIGRPGETKTSFRVLNSYDGSDATSVVIGIKGDKGDDGDITEELEDLRDLTFAARDAAEGFADDAEGFANDAESSADQAEAARIGAAAERVRAELAAIAAALLGGPIYDTVADGLAVATNGNQFLVRGEDSTSGLLIFEDLGGSPETAEQIGTLAGSGEVAALVVRVDALDPLIYAHTTFLDPEPHLRPRFLFDDGTFNDYDNISDPLDAVHFSPETIRLDVSERAGIAQTDVVPWFKGRITLSEDGTVVGGRRISDDFSQYGPAPETDFAAFRQGADGAGSIWVVGDGIDPFCVSGEHLGDNVGLVHYGFEGASWVNIPTSGAPSRKTFSFLPGIAAGALAGGVTTLILIIGTGQSTSNGSGSVPPVTTTSPAPGYLLMSDVTPPWTGSLQRGPRVLGHGQNPQSNVEPIDKHTLRLMIEAHETQEGGNGETQWTQAGYEMQKRLGNTYAVAVGVVGIGSVAYASVKKNTVIYNNMLEVIRHAYAVAKMSGLNFNVVCGWPQHESNQANSLATFLAHYTEFQSDVSADVALITNGEVTNVLFVTNAYNNATVSGSVFTEEGLAQLQFAIDNPTKGVIATPCFALARNVDGTHYTAVAGARDGSYMGRAVANQMLGRDALPLYTESVAIVAGEIRGTMHIPYGAGTLTDTSPFVTDSGALGFKLIRVSNGVEHPISSVSISTGQWVVVPTGAPAAGDYEISHGFRGTPGNGGGPTTGARTPINDDNPDQDFFGNAFPNHLVAQRFTVTF